jgi:hypothetical protein
VFATVLYVTVTGACWRLVDRLFGVDDATCHRYYTSWTKAGVWTRLRRAALDSSVPADWWTGPGRAWTPNTSAPKGAKTPVPAR